MTVTAIRLALRGRSSGVEFRRACIGDLPQVQARYQAVVSEMQRSGLAIWDQIYPAAVLPEDIRMGRLCLLEGEDGVQAAFALCPWLAEEDGMGWTEPQAEACCLERLAVVPKRWGGGLGTTALRAAERGAKEAGARYLRLFVVDTNVPAVKLYQRCGFYQVDGLHRQVVDESLTLWEYGFEKAVK